MNKLTTDTPLDACPHCGAEKNVHSIIYYKCHSSFLQRSALCIARQRADKAEAEVEFWKAKAHEAEFHEGKHEAEVEILREQLVKYRELANEILSHTSPCSVYHMQYSDWKDKLKFAMDDTIEGNKSYS